MLKKSKRLNTNIISLLICIIAAVGLWAYVTYVENPDMTRWIKNVPIVVSGETALREKGLSVSSISHEYMDVKIRTKRNQLQYFSAETVTATADVSRITHSGSALINVSINLPSSSSNASVVDRRSNTVTFTIENLAEKEFNIDVNVSKQPPSGYVIHKYTYDSESKVIVSGPSSLVNSVKKVCTSSIDLSTVTLSGAASSVVYPTSLMAFDAEGKTVSGIEFDVSEINVTFELYKTKLLPVTISYKTVNASLSASVTPESISVVGPIDLIDSVSDIKTEGIDAQSFIAGDTTRAALILPPQISTASGTEPYADIVFSAAQ